MTHREVADLSEKLVDAVLDCLRKEYPEVFEMKGIVRFQSGILGSLFMLACAFENVKEGRHQQ